MKPKIIQYYVAEFTTGRSQVLNDWTRAKTASNAVKYFEKEYGGIVYWVKGPFATKLSAEAYMQAEGILASEGK